MKVVDLIDTEKEVLTLLEKCQTMEELLDQKWRLFRSYSITSTKQNQLSKQAYQNFRRKKIDQARPTLSALLSTMEKEKRFNLSLILKETNLYSWEVKEVLEQEFAKAPCSYFAKVLTYVEQKLPSEVLKEQMMDYEEAQAIVHLFIKYDFTSKGEFRKQTGCGSAEITSAIQIIENKKTALSQELSAFLKKQQKRSEQKKSHSFQITTDKKNKDIIPRLLQLPFDQAILLAKEAKKESIYMKAFCEKNNLNFYFYSYYYALHPMKTMKIMMLPEEERKQQDSQLRNRFIKETQLMNQAIDEYEQNPTTIFPLYKYYQLGIRVDSLTVIANHLNLTQESAKISHFFKKHQGLFTPIEEQVYRGMIHEGILSCDHYSLFYKPEELKNAFRDIDRNALPYYQGVLFGALEEQQKMRESKQFTFIKKSTSFN